MAAEGLTFWPDSRQLPPFSPDLHEGDWPAEQLSALKQADIRRQPGTATLGLFMQVARRSRLRHHRLLLRQSCRSSDVESAHRGGPAARGSARPPPSEVARARERICRVPYSLRAAREGASQQNAAVEGPILFGEQGAAEWETAQAINSSAVAAMTAAATAGAVREAAAGRERREAEAATREQAGVHEARESQEAIAKKEAEVRALEEALAQERARTKAEEGTHQEALSKTRAEAAKRERHRSRAEGGRRGEGQDRS